MAKKAKGIKLYSASELKKKYGTTNAKQIVEESDTALRIPSRCIWLNCQTGGGLMYGRIHEGFGYESTGKSLVGMDYAYATQSLGGIVLWGDIERAFDYSWAETNGLDLERVEMFENSSVERFADWARDTCIYWRSKLTHNEPILLVADSIAAFDTDLQLNQDMIGGKATMGNRAKAIYQFYRTRNDLFADLGITVYMINQIRKKLNTSMFESAETQPGGEATKFYASIRISFNRGKQIKGRVSKGQFIEDKTRGHKVGQVVYSRIEKNKTAIPRGSVKTEVYFTDEKTGYVGFSRYEGLQDILIDKGVLIKRGNAYYYKFKKELRKLCGKYDDITLTLEANENARRFIIRKSGINTISKAREAIEATKGNFFKITDRAKNAESLVEDE